MIKTIIRLVQIFRQYHEELRLLSRGFGFTKQNYKNKQYYFRGQFAKTKINQNISGVNLPKPKINQNISGVNLLPTTDKTASAPVTSVTMNLAAVTKEVIF